VTVGHDALASAPTDPLNTIASAKRLIGRSMRDAAAADSPYRLESLGGSLAIRTAAGIRTPVDVGAQVLRVLHDRAQAALGGPITGAVITVPAYFDDAQRQATKDAAEQAGLTVLRLLNEPTAAAVAYGLDRSAQGVFLVYDLGGGTFDVSLLQLSGGVFEVLATGGDATLGGDDFDRRIVDWFVAELEDLHWQPADLAALLAAARQVKQALSDADAAVMHCCDAAGTRRSARLTRQAFEAMSRGLLDRTMASVRRVLRDARLVPSDIDGIVLVGGSTRMPMVRRAVTEHFGREPFTGIDPDEAVALGAAIQADQLVGNRAAGDHGLLLLDVCPLSLGLETMGGLVERIIPRNSTLPTARAQEFTTFKDGQTALSLHVVQGERELVDQCRSLARFTLRGIPPMAAGAARVRVTFQIDADGLLSVTATETTSGASAHVEVKPAHGLAHEQVSDMLRSALGHVEDDAAVRGLREAQIDARRLLDATGSALAEDGDVLLQPGEAADIRRAMQAVSDRLEAVAADGEGVTPDERRRARDALRDATESLNRVTTPFAGRRMDTRIRKVLGGRTLAQVA
jgi:molecular chaperone HscA